jgi:hypothetical protein
MNEMLQIYLHGQSLPTLRRRRREKVIFPREGNFKGFKKYLQVNSSSWSYSSQDYLSRRQLKILWNHCQRTLEIIFLDLEKASLIPRKIPKVEVSNGEV